ncbi:hypothetical protein L6452_23918 [Arctium lappa]|uniref:Uncharacterized protein n=1 Tax=Arctium lappa TaxID=4217 RepID=A0ACB9A9S9_ARCLA|nr:hypothetical protein L6452_23918 [Arctium lappa]
MSNPRRRRRFRQIENDENDENEDHNDSEERYRRYHREGGESELDRELESIMRRRRRSSATILQLLQGIRAGMITESENNVDREGGENNRERERERVILINPFNQTIIVQGGGGGGGNPFDSGGPSQNHPIGSLGDYFVGPGLELLLQHLAENDPNRYGTPPAQKEAVEAMPTVTIAEDSIQCSICLDDFEVGAEAKEMPCKHRFHGECILPWLELHSSCPVCRYQLPSDESKLERDREASQGIVVNTNAITGESENGGNGGEDGEDEGRNARRFSVALPWPFSSLFSSTSGTQITNSNPQLIMNPSNSSGSGSGSGTAGQEGGEGGRREDDD